MTVELFKIKFRFDFSFFAILTLMLLLSNEKICVMCFSSSLFHEAGHIALMVAFSCKPTVVEFSAFGLRIKRDSEILVSYKKQFFIAVAGIAVNLFVAAAFILLYLYSGNGDLKVFAFVNLFIALLNMIPIESLDMGRALYCIFISKFDEYKAMSVLSLISDVAVIMFTVFCVLYFIFISLNISLCAVCIYLIFINRKRRQTDVK